MNNKKKRELLFSLCKTHELRNSK